MTWQSLFLPSDFFGKFDQNVKKTVSNPANSQNLWFSSSIMLLALPKSTKREEKQIKINKNIQDLSRGRERERREEEREMVREREREGRKTIYHNSRSTAPWRRYW